MKTKSKSNAKPKSETFTVGPKEPVLEPQSESPNEAKPERMQVAFDVNPDGSLDTSSMRDRTKEKLRKVLADPNVAAALGITTSPAGLNPNLLFSEPMVNSLYTGLESLEQSVFPMFIKNVPAELIREYIRFTEQHRAILVPPTGRILQKHCSEWFLKWQDELFVGTMLLTITIAQCNALIAAAKELKQKQHGPATVTEIRQEPTVQ